MNQQIKSTCCYCGVGCGLLIETADGQIVGVRGDPEHPANLGRLCSKGATLHLTARPDYRLLHPELRLDAQSAAPACRLGRGARSCRRPLCRDHRRAWSGQRRLLRLRAVADRGLLRLQQARQGADRHQQHRYQLAPVHVVGGGRLQADARRRRATVLLRGHRPADCLLIAGANPAIAHPIVFRRIEDARAANPELRIIVIDPRRSETAAIADLHLALKPGHRHRALQRPAATSCSARGSSIATTSRAIPRASTNSKQIVAAYPPAAVAASAASPKADIIQAARWFGTPARRCRCTARDSTSRRTARTTTRR
jgi:assimilatory nitrate reductase catalytic subunit